MEATRPGKHVKDLLKAYPSEVQDLALQARRLVLESIPKAEETVDSSAGVIGYGFGSGYSGTICTLILSKSGVKLGIVRGAEILDPHRLLEGSGKVHRYVQLRKSADLERPGLKPLLKAALAAWKERVRDG